MSNTISFSVTVPNTSFAGSDHVIELTASIYHNLGKAEVEVRVNDKLLLDSRLNKRDRISIARAWKTMWANWEASGFLGLRKHITKLECQPAVGDTVQRAEAYAKHGWVVSDDGWGGTVMSYTIAR